VLLPFLPNDDPPSGTDDTRVFNRNYSTFDNLPTYSPTSAAEPLVAASGDNLSSEDISPKPRLRSASKSRVEKRQANTLAARRYRRNRLDKVADLESALRATQLERDALIVQVAKLQGETQALKDLVRGPFWEGNGETF